MSSNQQQPQQPQQQTPQPQQPAPPSQQAPQPGPPMPPGASGQPQNVMNQGNNQQNQRFGYPPNQQAPQQQQFMGQGPPMNQAQQQQMMMQQQQFQYMMGGGGAGGHQIYRQKSAPQGYTGPQNPQTAAGGGQLPAMGGPQMYAMGGLGGMAGGLMGPMAFGGQMQNGMMMGQQTGMKRDFPQMYALYIGNLNEKTFDLDLLKFFTAKGYKISSAKVMFDRETKKSKCFGYLNFYTAEEAERCLEEMNNAIIDNRAIVLNKKKDVDFDNKANVLIKNLPKDMTQKDLQSQFAKFGNIKSCKLECFLDGTSRGYGYVQFEKVEDAQRAIEEMNESLIQDKKIEVTFHQKKADREDQGDNFTNLYVQNLPEDYSVEQLRGIFAEFGDIDSINVSTSKPGTGFVSFKDHAKAKEALEKTNKMKINDTAILVSPHVYRKENDLYKNKSGFPNAIVKNQKEAFKSNIFVRFIPKDVSEMQLREKFQEAGPIASIKLREHEQKINGEVFSNYKIGYVLYDDVSSAQRCIKMFDESRCFGYNQKPLKVDFWQSKDDLKYEKEEKSYNSLSQLVHLVMSQSKVNNQLPRVQRQWSAGNAPQMQGEGYKGNRYNPNRGRGGYRQGGRGGPRGGGGHNKNQNQQNQYHNNQQQQRGGSQKYGAAKQGVNKQYMPQGGQPGQITNQQMNNQAPPDQQAQQMQAQQPQQPQQPQQQFQQSQYPQMQLPGADVAELDQLVGEDRRTFVGNNIYSKIEDRFGEELAPIITGTLLDENVVDFKQLFTNAQYFTNRVYEAHQLLMQSKSGGQPQQQT